jgi:hypothetical protein
METPITPPEPVARAPRAQPWRGTLHVTPDQVQDILDANELAEQSADSTGEQA